MNRVERVVIAFSWTGIKMSLLWSDRQNQGKKTIVKTAIEVMTSPNSMMKKTYI
jgi:hypothetical protein